MATSPSVGGVTLASLTASREHWRVLSAWLALVLTTDPYPCTLPRGVELGELTEQVLPISSPASVARASPPLRKLIARARALNKRQDADQVAATLPERMAVLAGFLALCNLESDQLVVMRTMLNLTITAGELGKWEPTRSELVAAARSVTATHPRSARAHLYLAAALQVVVNSAPAREDRSLAQKESEAAAAKCHELDAALDCALKR